MKEAKFQGISVEEAIAQHDHVEAPPSPSSEEEQHDAHPAADYEIPAHPHDDQLDSDKQIPIQEPPAKPKVQRPPKVEQEPSVKYADARRQSGSSDEWGTGDSGYKIPKTPSDRMRYVFMSFQLTMLLIGLRIRKNVPYKVGQLSHLLKHGRRLIILNSTSSGAIGAISDCLTSYSLKFGVIFYSILSLFDPELCFLEHIII